jgi:uncharacterized LabA/DUF88 family protein
MLLAQVVVRGMGTSTYGRGRTMSEHLDREQSASRSALFVDFDNMYLGLRKLDENAAEAFASRPTLWLQWLEAGLDAGGKTKRRFLVKNVYLNPVTFGSYRAVYTRNGFRSIDCPPLTGQGKNSADIYMVLDIVDALQSGFRYDEFVIASTDADFTPILHRLRGQDRRTTLLTAGLSAAAYRAVCDSFVSPEVLADVALGQFDDVEAVVEQEPVPSIMMPPSSAARQVATEPKPSRTEEDMAEVRAAVRAAVATADGPLVSAAAAQAALKVRPNLKQTDWWGAGSFRAFLALYLEDLAYEGNPSPGYVYDPRRHSRADLPGPERPELGTFVQQVCMITGAPAMTSERYASLFSALADDLAAAPYERNETPKRVRDRTDVSGTSVARGSVSFVAQGLIFSGQKLDSDPSARELAGSYLAYVKNLCANARMTLSTADEETLEAWILGSIPSDKIEPAPGDTDADAVL